MSDVAFLLVLSSAVFHAVWNFYAKKSTAHSVAIVWAAQLSAGVLMLPLTVYLFWSEGLSTHGAFFVVVTSLIHAVYIWLLGSSYELGDISVVYPVARGTGIAGTAVLATLLGIDSLLLIGVLGVGAIFVGTLVIGFRSSGSNEVYRAAFLVGCSIASYSIVDKVGVTHVSPLLYVNAMNILASLILLPWMLRNLPVETKSVLTNHKRYAAAIGLAALGTYALVLWAFQLSPASYVVALRETSIVIATILGVLVLKEGPSRRKVYGVLLIVFGAILVKIA